ncbi:uncharacterized protein BO66DRAFT_442445 [Aspergillus aculeatinus CBS 121060]|uniref:Uncharacterized protein n=1 Tax=Aspergillus aculeatinus CBS 121060 TaxID=1448322 RepID=A0ACD1GXL0_9EURO|nr:hypothetical protein BO66DRAFT_442445 [Aspergillus aculeatinus CBS 121060]RAH66057.1 hypothetical protein BO66DRAFT_442445 [Aspergillus aculeatinus CBS 121060]
MPQVQERSQRVHALVEYTKYRPATPRLPHSLRRRLRRRLDFAPARPSPAARAFASACAAGLPPHAPSSKGFLLGGSSTIGGLTEFQAEIPDMSPCDLRGRIFRSVYIECCTTSAPPTVEEDIASASRSPPEGAVFSS